MSRPLPHSRQISKFPDPQAPRSEPLALVRCRRGAWCVSANEEIWNPENLPCCTPDAASLRPRVGAVWRPRVARNGGVAGRAWVPPWGVPGGVPRGTPGATAGRATRGGSGADCRRHLQDITKLTIKWFQGIIKCSGPATGVRATSPRASSAPESRQRSQRMKSP